MNVIRSYDRADGKASAATPASVIVTVDTNDPEWTDAFRADWRTGMTAVWSAWKVGYLAVTGGNPKPANPYLRPGEDANRPAYPISGGWHSGWLCGQGKRAEDVELEFSRWRSGR